MPLDLTLVQPGQIPTISCGSARLPIRRNSDMRPTNMRFSQLVVLGLLLLPVDAARAAGSTATRGPSAQLMTASKNGRYGVDPPGPPVPSSLKRERSGDRHKFQTGCSAETH